MKTNFPQPVPEPAGKPLPFKLDRERLFGEIEFHDTVCPMREDDGSLHLVAQELEDLDYVPKLCTEQVVRFDEGTQTVEWEAFCLRWRVPDVDAALKFASDWMRHHEGDTVFVDAPSGQIRWRRSFPTGWVEDEDDLESLCSEQIYDAMHDCIECLQAAQLALGGF